MTRTKGSSLAAALPLIRRYGALGSPSCSFPSCITIMIILGTLLGSRARQHYIRLGLFIVFDPESCVIIAILVLLVRVLWRQRNGRGSNVRLKSGQNN